MFCHTIYVDYLFREDKNMNRIKELYNKYREAIAYLFFGFLGVAVNLIVYYICAHIFYIEVVLSTVIAWICSVSFAFVTNKIWVFESKDWTKSAVFKEITSFFMYRILTGILDVIIMYICVDKLFFNDMLIKIISSIIVIILNYVASKLIVFKKK